MYKYFATTIPGVEDISARELEKIVGVKPEIDVNKVFLETDLEAMYKINFMSRTINKLYILLAREEFKDLNDIYRIVKNTDFRELIRPDMRFAVRAERIGEHNFTSIDIARVAGQAIIDSYIDSMKTRLKVDLENPDIEINVLVRFNEILIGVNTSGESLHKRKYRVYNHPASMIFLGDYAGEPLLDPLCGGGTIPIEAAHIARKYPISIFRREYYFRRLPLHNESIEKNVEEKLISSINKEIYEIYCVDISREHIRGALLNAKNALVDDTIKFFNRDSTRRESFEDIEAKLIVTNPPYGMRSHSLKKIEGFYETFLKTLKEVYQNIKLVLITASTQQFENAVEKADVKIIHSRKVMHGGLTAKIYMIKI
jgi:tRNA (guanine6-N2)-methyltransferase